MLPKYLFQRNSRSWTEKLKKFLVLIVEILRSVVTQCTGPSSQPKPLVGDLNIRIMFQYTLSHNTYDNTSSIFDA